MKLKLYTKLVSETVRLIHSILFTLPSYTKVFLQLEQLLPAGIYLVKVNNTNTRARCETCSELTINLLTLNIFHMLF